MSVYWWQRLSYGMILKIQSGIIFGINIWLHCDTIPFYMTTISSRMVSSTLLVIVNMFIFILILFTSNFQGINHDKFLSMIYFTINSISYTIEYGTTHKKIAWRLQKPKRYYLSILSHWFPHNKPFIVFSTTYKRAKWRKQSSE